MPLGLGSPPLGRLSLAVVRRESSRTSPDDGASEFQAMRGGGASFSPVQGLDGAALQKEAAACLQSLHREGLVDLEDERLSALTWGALAEAGTHQRLWRDAARRRGPVLLLDASRVAAVAEVAGSLARELEGAMRSLPETWDVLALSWSADTEAELSSPSVPGFRFRVTAESLPSRSTSMSESAKSRLTAGGSSLLRAHRLEGLSRSYVVSPQGAEKLLKACSPIHCSVQEALERELPTLEAFACFPPLLLPADANAEAPVADPISEEARLRCIGSLLPPPPSAVPQEGTDREEGQSSKTGRPAVLWQVIGGRGFGGIIVRAEAGLSSQLQGRLQFGAVLQEEDREGGRIHFKKVSGDGPNRGWVSISSQGKELLQAVSPSVAAQLQTTSGAPSARQSGRGSLSSAEQRWRQEADDRRRSAVKLYEQRKREVALEVEVEVKHKHKQENEQENEHEEERALRKEGQVPATAGAPLGSRTDLSMESLHEDQDDQDDHDHDHDHEANISEMWASGDLEKAWWHDSGGNGKTSRRFSKHGEDTESPRTMKSTTSLGFHIPDYDPDEPHGLVPPAPAPATATTTLAAAAVTAAAAAASATSSTGDQDLEQDLDQDQYQARKEDKDKERPGIGAAAVDQHPRHHAFDLGTDDEDDENDEGDEGDEQRRAPMAQEFSLLDEDDDSDVDLPTQLPGFPGGKRRDDSPGVGKILGDVDVLEAFAASPLGNEADVPVAG